MASPMADSIFDDEISSDNYSPEPKTAKSTFKKPTASASSTAKTVPMKLTQSTLKPKIAISKKRKTLDSDEENSDHDGDSLDDNSGLSNTPPKAKKQKPVPQQKKSGGNPLQPVTNESYGPESTPEPIPKKANTTHNQYQKLTQLEHILKRPDTYIGSIERTEKQMWVFNSESKSIESREVSYVPGLYKIFDEVLVNAADNKQNDKNMDEIKVTIDRETGQISVRNNGRGIPIEIHSKEGIYIPEMIFGHLLTSSNYDDDEQKVTGGRNGYGAKLCNIYSTQFILETVDSKCGKKYKQTWTDNMSIMDKAKITPCKGDDYTMVTFTPDFRRFGMTGIDADFEGLVKRRVYDMAGTCKDVKVFLNGEKIAVRNFKKYMEMYNKAIKFENASAVETDAKDTPVILTDKPNERWEIGFAVSDGSFQQVSFVNSIATTSGGTHVNYIADQIVTKLMEIVKKKNKGGVILKNNQIRNHIFLFVNCLIVNPAFTSQTKEQLTTKASQFGSKCAVSEKFLKDIAKTEAVTNILHFAQQKADQVLKKSDGNRRTRMNNSKLTDANKAGTKDGHRCTLILTEGDSASLLALAGRAVVDPDLIGVFPLRGKLLNVRDASVEQISKNAEIQNIKKFMGLQHKKNYEDTKSLRYGHLMIMTDQDHDGSHIKGLLINFLEVTFPSLLKIPGFLKEFITPIVKVWKGDPKNPKKLQAFFTMPEYEAWKEQVGNGHGWDHKYYKGLGTSSPSDAEIYFRDLDKHLKEFHVMRSHEPAMIDMAFSKKKADARKEWLREFQPGTYLDMTTNDITYDDFVNKELILFSMVDNQRSIPSVLDGLKPGQRKVLYTCFRRNLKKDVKVVELAGSVSGLTAYAYGDTSLQQTIVGLAQTFVGSNNINCLEPSGNFGSRLQGGSDCASARYIYTRLSPFARKIFPANDEPLLTYNIDDGKTIEPEAYVPIVPMILINGADGIGTGWSSSIPNYSPEDIVENLKRRMNGSSKEDMHPMKPWFRGWQGEVEDIGGDRYKFNGAIRQTGDNEVEITELPVRIWTQDFKDRLEDIIKAEKVPSFIKDYTEYNTPVKVHFIIKMEDKHMGIAIERGLEETFKLSKTMATSNLVAFDGQGRIHKYGSVLDIMEEFFLIRLRFYEKRKEYMLNEMSSDLEKLSNQSRFIKMIIDGKLVVAKKKKLILVAELKEKNFKPIPKIADARKEGEFEAVVNNEGEGNADEVEEDREIGANDYDYLLGMAIWSLTQERIDKLMRQIGDKEIEIDKLIKTSPKQLWITDLDDFIAEWRFQLEDEAKREKKIAGLGRRASTKLRIGGSKAVSKKRKVDDDDDDEFRAEQNKKQASGPLGKTKPSSMFNYLIKNSASPPPKPAAKPTAKTTLVNAIEQKPVARPPAEERGLLLGRDWSAAATPLLEHVKISAIAEKPPVAAAAAPLKAVKSTKKTKVVSDDDSDNNEDVFTAVAQEARANETTKPVGRQARAASRKPVKYANSENSDMSDNGENLLENVSNLVKGITGVSGTANGSSKPLFSASASRPLSSAGLTAKARSAKTFKPMSNHSDEADDTDYTKPIPKNSPQKPAARNARAIVLSDDEDDSFEMVGLNVPLKATNAKPAVDNPTAIAKPRAALVEKAKKPVVAPATKEKAVPLPSPAATAYAKRQAKGKAALAGGESQPPAKLKLSAKEELAAKKKKPVVDDDEDDEMDVSALANDILTDGDSEEDVKPNHARPLPPANTARPSRRAAAASTAKSRYVVDDEEDDEDEASEADYDENGGSH